MYILGIHTGHDASACLFKDQQMIAFCKEERLSRKKSDSRFHLESINEVLKIAGIDRQQIDVIAITRMELPIESFKKITRPFKKKRKWIWKKLHGENLEVHLFDEMSLLNLRDEFEIIDARKLKHELGLSEATEVCFVNHHLAHALGAFYYTDWERDALFITCDGVGDRVCYSAHIYDGNNFQTVYGGEEACFDQNLRQSRGFSIGYAYSLVTKLLGFIPLRHEGKVTGLAAFGEPIHGQEIRDFFSVNTTTGEISGKFTDRRDLQAALETLLEGCSPENIAASIQAASESLVLDWVKALLKLYPTQYIGMSGGVFANVRLNQEIAAIEGIKEVFIFPPMGDEGLSAGACIKVLMDKYSISKLQRTKLKDVYLGREYSSNQFIETAQDKGFKISKYEHQELCETTAKLLAKGKIGAIYSQRMEMGPRALGARSIIASPSVRELNDTLNERLHRTEFMPFAPYVLDVDAAEVFDLNECNWEAARFMTITTDVKPKYHDMIPAVVHVDGTARPQIIERETNPLYYDLLAAFKKETGIPCLVNTSFNAHEEPIINTPEEALVALSDDRVDFLVCESGLVFK